MDSVLGTIAVPISDRSPSNETISLIRDGIREVLKIARALLRIQKDLYAIGPPQGFTEVHLAFGGVAPALLRKLWSLAEFAGDMVEGKLGENHAPLKFDLDGSELKPMAAALNDLNRM